MSFHLTLYKAYVQLFIQMKLTVFCEPEVNMATISGKDLHIT